MSGFFLTSAKDLDLNSAATLLNALQKRESSPADHLKIGVDETESYELSETDAIRVQDPVRITLDIIQ